MEVITLRCIITVKQEQQCYRCTYLSEDIGTMQCWQGAIAEYAAAGCTGTCKHAAKLACRSEGMLCKT